jgi:dihydroflavonol-4-reductase
LAELFDIAEDLTGIDAPRRVPCRVFRWLGHAMAVVETVTRPPSGYESELLHFFDSGRILVDNSKAQRELGIEHRPLRESVREYLEWELAKQDVRPPEPLGE